MNYGPTRSEVFMEMGRGVKDFCLNFGDGFAQGFVFSYSLPTQLAKHFNKKDDLGLKASGAYGALLGAMSGMASIIPEAVIGIELCYQGEYAAGIALSTLHITTNVASGIYEVFNGFYQGTKENMIQQDSSLDCVIEER